MTDTPLPPNGPDRLEPDAAGRARASDGIDPYGPLDPVDEAASAAMDGVAPDEGAAPVDPARLEARVQELTEIVGLLAEPVRPPDASVIDTHITAALDALDAGEVATGSVTPGATTPAAAATTEHAAALPAVAPLADRRRRHAVGRWLAVAAAVAVIALAIPVVQSLSKSTSSSQDTASVASGAADSNGAEATSKSQSSVAPERSGFDASSTTTFGPTDATTAPVTGADLGAAETPQALTALVQGAVPPDSPASTSAATSDATLYASPTTTAATARSSTHCDASNRASHTDLGALRYTATATYQSVPVEVAVYDVTDSPGSSRLIATSVSDCGILLDQLIP